MAGDDGAKFGEQSVPIKVMFAQRRAFRIDQAGAGFQTSVGFGY